MIRENRDFLSQILWTDEADWSVENPRWMREVQHQGRWSVNVRCGIIGMKIIGRYFFHGTLTGNVFFAFFNKFLAYFIGRFDIGSKTDYVFPIGRMSSTFFPFGAASYK